MRSIFKIGAIKEKTAYVDSIGKFMLTIPVLLRVSPNVFQEDSHQDSPRVRNKTDWPVVVSELSKCTQISVINQQI